MSALAASSLFASSPPSSLRLSSPLRLFASSYAGRGTRTLNAFRAPKFKTGGFSTLPTPARSTALLSTLFTPMPEGGFEPPTSCELSDLNRAALPYFAHSGVYRAWKLGLLALLHPYVIASPRLSSWFVSLREEGIEPSTPCGLSGLNRAALPIFAHSRGLSALNNSLDSGRRGSNPRPPVPQTGALPGCATSRDHAPEAYVRHP